MSLDNLKKQAKLLVRWHRDGNYSVGGRIRWLPRYSNLSDAEILALPFPLSEAQEIIALERGYGTWAELRTGLQPKGVGSSPTTPVAPRLTQAIPVVFVSDVERASCFYRDELGFVIDFLHGEPPFYGSVSRDEARIHLRFVHEPARVSGLREKEELLSAFLSVTGVRALFSEYKSKDVPFVHRLKKQAWGQSAFIVRDPDGNWLCFAG